MKDLISNALTRLLMAMTLLFAISTPLHADVEIQELSKVFDKFTVGGEINLFYRYDSNPWFGTELSSINPEFDADTHTSYGETFSRIRFTATKDIGWAELSGQFAPFFAETIGQDFYGTYDNEQEIGIDQAWIKFAKIGGTPLDLTLGRQEIKVEKWFVVADGEDQGVANWLYYHSSFPLAVKLDGDFGAVKGSIFYAEAGDYVKDWTDLFAGGPETDVTLAGVNLHWDINEKMFVYGGVFSKNEDDAASGGVGNEDDTTAFDIGVDVTMGGLQLEGEYVHEIGDTGIAGDEDRDANAYFASATYRFATPLAPYVRGMYIFFSGDDPTTDDNEEYDPMFFDFQSWNHWVIGELVGEAQLPNQNKNDFIMEAGFSPMEPMTISLMYIKHTLEEKETSAYGPVSSHDWASEWNLFIDWPIGDHLFASTCLGIVNPDDAAKEVFGNDDAFFAQLFLNFSF